MLQAEEIPPLIKEHGQFYDLKWQRFLKKGGKKEHIVEIKKVEDFFQLISNHFRPKTINIKGLEHRFNYIMTQAKLLRLSRYPKTSAEKVAQDLLTKGDPIIAAGEIYIFGSKKNPLIGITNRSKKFCTPYSHLKTVEDKINQLGISFNRIITIDYTTKFCSSSKARR